MFSEHVVSCPHLKNLHQCSINGNLNFLDDGPCRRQRAIKSPYSGLSLGMIITNVVYLVEVLTDTECGDGFFFIIDDQDCRNTLHYKH